MTDVAPLHPSFSCQGRVALVTGASSGFGARFARVLDSAGARVIITARRSDRLDSIAHDLAEPLSLPGDITDPAHRQGLVDAIRDKFGRLDILVNNAGVADDGLLEDQSLDELNAVLDVNLVAVLDLCRLAAPLLFAAKHASVVNVASMYGLVASRGGMAGYNASKGAVVNLTRNLAAQWGTRGVRVNALAPGFFPTEMTGMLSDEAWAGTISARTLIGRVPAIADIDGPLLFLASDASSYVTGHTLVVDGGWTAV
ncbi:MAG TPA: SDR family oxidoreductase [Candidatus Dormibacteraeota bacterium]|jgi:hypothetical protein